MTIAFPKGQEVLSLSCTVYYFQPENEASLPMNITNQNLISNEKCERFQNDFNLMFNHNNRYPQEMDNRLVLVFS